METGEKNYGNVTLKGKNRTRALKPQLNAAVLLFAVISQILQSTQVSPG